MMKMDIFPTNLVISLRMKLKDVSSNNIFGDLHFILFLLTLINMDFWRLFDIQLIVQFNWI